MYLLYWSNGTFPLCLCVYDGNDAAAAGEWIGLLSKSAVWSMKKSTWIINTSFELAVVGDSISVCMLILNSFSLWDSINMPHQDGNGLLKDLCSALICYEFEVIKLNTAVWCDTFQARSTATQRCPRHQVQFHLPKKLCCHQLLLACTIQCRSSCHRLSIWGFTLCTSPCSLFHKWAGFPHSLILWLAFSSE